MGCFWPEAVLLAVLAGGCGFCRQGKRFGTLHRTGYFRIANQHAANSAAIRVAYRNCGDFVAGSALAIKRAISLDPAYVLRGEG